MRIHVVILAGGRGERFWPLSRRGRPKQFLPLLGERSLLAHTAERLRGWIPPGRIWAVADGTLMPEVRRHVGADLDPGCCIEEPAARNTAAAVGVAAAAIEAVDPGALMLVLPSDHWIPDADAFRSDVIAAAEAESAVGGLHLFGIPITRPETGYGYVERGESVPGHRGVSTVRRFHEKPDRARALAYAENPAMLWNSGIFLWKASTIIEEIAGCVPAVARSLAALVGALRASSGRIDDPAREAVRTFFDDAPSESIDVAVLELCAKPTYVTQASFRWSDMGSWLSWGEQLPGDPAGNRGRGRLLLRDVKDCVLYSEDGVLAMLGVEGLIVVHLADVTLVCARDRAQDVKALLRDAAGREDMDDVR